MAMQRLVAMTIGRRRRLCRRDNDRDEFHRTLNDVMPTVNLAFFSLAGASLKLDALAHTAWLASVVCLVRAVAIYGGSFLGCWASECPPEHRKRLWQTMLTQVRQPAVPSHAWLVKIGIPVVAVCP
jgi:NhaP-type Na+/H+ or K+/H+ antiporter